MDVPNRAEGGYTDYQFIIPDGCVFYMTLEDGEKVASNFTTIDFTEDQMDLMCEIIRGLLNGRA